MSVTLTSYPVVTSSGKVRNIFAGFQAVELEFKREDAVVVDVTQGANNKILISINGDIRSLTFKEAELIRIFAENPNKVLSRNDILQKIWGSDDYFLGRSLDVFISRLRKYFKADTNIKITNLHGIGFRFSVK